MYREPVEAFPAATAEHCGLDRARLERFASELPRWVEAGEVVGAELLIVTRRRTVLHCVAGWRDRERRVPMRKGTIFAIRSMSKPLVGMAALMLAEEGRLGLDDPVRRWLPAFDNERSREVTVEHLMRHTGGFGHPGFPRRITEYRCAREAADAVGDVGPEVPPGTRFVYSDAGSTVLGAVVGAAAGAPLEDVVRERILVPLRMDDTFCHLREEEPRRLRMSCAYKLRRGGFERYWDVLEPPLVPFFAGAGGVCSTVCDYAKLLACWMDGGRAGGTRLLAEESVRRGLTVTPESRSAGAHGSYAMQWYLYSEADPADGRVVEVFGHDGSDGTWGMAAPKLDLMVLYFTQSRDGQTLWKVMDLVRGLVEPA